MRYLVQGGQEQEQEQELSLGCGCWWSLAKSVASHVVVVMVGQKWRFGGQVRTREVDTEVPKGRRCLPLVRLVQPPVGRW